MAQPDFGATLVFWLDPFSGTEVFDLKLAKMAKHDMGKSRADPKNIFISRAVEGKVVQSRISAYSVFRVIRKVSLYIRN